MRPAALRRDLQRLLTRLGLEGDPDAPREIAVVVALRDGIPLRDALERLGIDTEPLDLPSPPEAVAFARIAPGHGFSWQDHVWTRAILDQALVATPDRRAHPHVIAAYLAAIQRGQAATAFRWSLDQTISEPTCLAARVEAEALVYPAAPQATPSPRTTPEAWIPTVDQSPELGRMVTVDSPSGPVLARLLLTDESPGGAVWEMASGRCVDLDEVSLWRA